MNVRELGPRVVRVSPAPCADAAAAAVAVARALELLPEGFSRVLADLGGYASPRRAPAALVAVDAVVLAVASPQARKADVQALAADIPAAKNLGAILVG